MEKSRLTKLGSLRNLRNLLLIFGAGIFLSACSAPTGTLFYGSLAKGNSALIVLSGLTNGPQAIVAYDTNGNYLETLVDLTYNNLTPTGVAPYNGFSFVVSLGAGGVTGDLDLVQTTGGYSNFVTNSNLNGALYQMGYHAKSGAYLIIKANTIEGYTYAGSRILSPVIAATVGSCTLATPKALTIDQKNNKLWVVNTAATVQLLEYDLTNINAVTCVGVNSATMGANAPLAVTWHDSGYIYAIANTTHKMFAFNASTALTNVAGAGTNVYTDSGTVLSTSTAMVELPDGTVLVANSGTKEIDRFQVNGTSAATRVGSSAFIKDVYTTQVNDMMVIKGL